MDLPLRTSLPRISPSDKLKIFPDATDVLPKRWTDSVTAGVPAFWGETKSVATWERLLDEVDGGACVDLSPGSGALASACMSRGIQYLGLVTDATHQLWLTKVIDRAALKYICQSGNMIYQDDLASHLTELFADVLEANEDETLEEAIMGSDTEA